MAVDIFCFAVDNFGNRNGDFSAFVTRRKMLSTASTFSTFYAGFRLPFAFGKMPISISKSLCYTLFTAWETVRDFSDEGSVTYGSLDNL